MKDEYASLGDDYPPTQMVALKPYKKSFTVELILILKESNISLFH